MEVTTPSAVAGTVTSTGVSLASSTLNTAGALIRPRIVGTVLTAAIVWRAMRAVSGRPKSRTRGLLIAVRNWTGPPVSLLMRKRIEVPSALASSRDPWPAAVRALLRSLMMFVSVGASVAMVVANGTLTGCTTPSGVTISNAEPASRFGLSGGTKSIIVAAVPRSGPRAFWLAWKPISRTVGSLELLSSDRDCTFALATRPRRPATASATTRESKRSPIFGVTESPRTETAGSPAVESSVNLAFERKVRNVPTSSTSALTSITPAPVSSSIAV